jgi:hypothetical protein
MLGDQSSYSSNLKHIQYLMPSSYKIHVLQKLYGKMNGALRTKQSNTRVDGRQYSTSMGQERPRHFLSGRNRGGT